jgi:hypothetical protein
MKKKPWDFPPPSLQFTVIAIVGILAAILIPAIGQFLQWLAR